MDVSIDLYKKISEFSLPVSQFLKYLVNQPKKFAYF